MFNKKQYEAFARTIEGHPTPMQITLSNYDGCMNFIVDEQRMSGRTKYEIDVEGNVEVLYQVPEPDSAV